MVHTRSGKKTASVEGIAYSIASEEEMDSPRSVRSQGQQAEDDVDPQMYAMFKEMMTKMLAEQAETSTEKTRVKQKAKDQTVKKVLKLSKKHIQYEDTSDESESVGGTDEEYEVWQALQRSSHRQGTTYKLKNQAMDDPIQIQLKEMAKKIKDLEARDKGKKVSTSKDFYKSITPVRYNQD
jgi:O6-methylguanine-DNA--protein-cysteine methyltransferase